MRSQRIGHGFEPHRLRHIKEQTLIEKQLSILEGCFSSRRNGAGKTTTMKSILGTVLPEKGDVHIIGLDAKRNERRLLFINLERSSE